MMEGLKDGLLALSLLANAAFVIFILVLQFTPYLDIPLATYSHQKNCEQDFQSVLKMANQVPADQRETVKQLYASVICQKDYQTGEQIGANSFSQIIKQLENKPQ
jgi:hypothetical protein